MTEESIIKELSVQFDTGKYLYQIPRSFIYKWESDFWVMDKDGNTKEFEIKISRADYFKDALKDKHKECLGANYFYYVCPKDLIKKHEVDVKYGLVYVDDNGNIYIEKKPRRLNENKFNDWRILANKMYWKWYSLWKDKWIDKQISRTEFKEGFSIELFEQYEINKIDI